MDARVALDGIAVEESIGKEMAAGIVDIAVFESFGLN